MNDRYVALWPQVRQIEGASQRVQEDAMRFAGIMESLGTRFIDAVMTLIAFLPILWGLSSHIKEIPVFGEVAYALVWIAIGWSVFGTGILALAGYRLPGLEFRNQAGRGRPSARSSSWARTGEDRAQPADPRRAVRECPAKLFPPLPQLPLFQRRPLRLSPGRGDAALYRARADHRLGRLHARPRCSRSSAPSTGWRTRSSSWSIPGRPS